MGIDIAGLERQEAISFFMWVQSLNKTGFPKNGDGTMKDIWQLYDYWDSMDGMDKKAFWTHARTKEPQAAAALLSGEDWISVKDRLPEDNEDYQVWEFGSLVPSVAHYLTEKYFRANYNDENYMEVGWYYSHGYVFDDCLPEIPLRITHYRSLPEPPKP